ncbi:unnamed protein product [Sphagnum balticum]
MNPFSHIDFNYKTVRCCFCGTVTALPPNYAQFIQPNKLPYELMPANTTYEYKIVNKNAVAYSTVGEDVRQQDAVRVAEEYQTMVRPDSREMQDEAILLLDTYFVVVEWYGETVKSWEEAKYH